MVAQQFAFGRSFVHVRSVTPVVLNRCCARSVAFIHPHLSYPDRTHGPSLRRPWILLLLLALPVLALVVFRFRGDPARGCCREHLEREQVTRARGGCVFSRCCPCCGLAAVALFIVALARPQRGEAVSETGGEGIDIVLAYDASSSMTQPFARGQTRLQAAEQVLKRFVEGRENDRVGLVVFRGNALTLSPLTIDYAAVSEAVTIAPTIRLDDGTAIGTAMGESINLLRTSESASKIVILLTDGENNSPTIEPLAAAAPGGEPEHPRLHDRRGEPQRESQPVVAERRRNGAAARSRT